jgi:hypothetical protein
MAIWTYVLTRDFGFAPNPFHAICSLATCKPGIRYGAKIDDWVLGFGSSKKGSSVAGKLIYAMKVQKKLTFDEYWSDEAYYKKRPVMNGSLMQKYGDNIYHHIGEVWMQENSHHTNKDGSINNKNLNRDTKRDAVLLTQDYWYWGRDAVVLPDSLKDLIKIGRGNKKNTDVNLANALSDWLRTMPENGLIGYPAKFGGEFQRYDGK